MSTIVTYSEARQNLASLLDKVLVEGAVRIKRRDGQVFVIRTDEQRASPLDVDGIDLGVSTEEIVDFIAESRRYSES